MTKPELPEDVRTKILAALDHDADARVFTDFLQAEIAPNGEVALVFYDRWEFHMGAESAKVALAASDGTIQRAFPFDAMSTVSGWFLASWRGDSSRVAIARGGSVLIWSVPDARFALCGIAFNASSFEWTDDALLVRQSTYRVGKEGGYYDDGPRGARFPLSSLRWHGVRDLARVEELSQQIPQVEAGAIVLKGVSRSGAGSRT